MTKPLTLTAHLKAYAAAREVSKTYIIGIQCALRSFGEHLGHEPTIDDLTTDAINGWLAWALAGPLKRETVANYRRVVLTLWRDLYDLSIITVWPRRIRPIKLERRQPIAWTAAQVRRLLAEADKQRGCFTNDLHVRKSYFWRAFIMTLWDSGLRLGDMLALTTSDVLGKSRFSIVQHKTGQLITIRLRPETVAAIKKTYPPKGKATERNRVFGALCRRGISVNFRGLVKAAGLSCRHGTTRILRRSSATAVEMENPGTATRHLGHRCADVAMRHYLDQNILDKKKPIAPSLVDSTNEDDDTQPARDNDLPITSAAELQDVLGKMLERAKAAEPVVEVKAAVVDDGNAPLMLDLLEGFMAAVKGMSKDYNHSTRVYLRQTIEALEMHKGTDLDSTRLRDYLASLEGKGKTGRMVKWHRYPLLRFLKWLMLRDDATGKLAAECLGRLTIMLPAGRGRKEGAA